MTTTPEARIAEALERHRLTFRDLILREDDCRCGWAGSDHAAHQAAVIAALPDIAIVELPSHRGVNGLDHPAWHAGRVYVELDFDGTVTLDDRHVIDRDDVPTLAAALLAAARAVGGES